MVDKEHLQALITNRQRRLQKLKEQQARLGPHTPPEILIEIEDIEIEIEKDLKRLEQLTGFVGVPEDVRDIIQNAIWDKATELDLSYKRLTSLPPEIAKLTHLRKLDLSINQLTSLPLEISELENLEILDLRSNQLRVLPGEISKLGKLKELDLRINRLTGLPDEIAQLTNLTLLRLEKNLLPIPSEILEQLKQPKEIIDYYFKYRDSTFEKRPLSEAKVILVGEGGVGKTSLVNRLLANRFDPHEIKTDGINIQHYHITVDDDKAQNIDVWLNLWDFGGQEIMHATHQFFLTKRSLYILVLDARRGEQESRVEYWLKLIRSFAGNSPIIVVCNKSDEHQLELDWTGLEKKYPNIRAFIKRMSCQTGEGIGELNQLIKRGVAKLEHINDPLLVSWFAVKTQLEEMEENYISYQDYQELCRSESILDEASQRTLIGFLHDLGIILHFQDHPILEDTNVLNPEWVTKAVYKILNSSKLAQNKGVLDITDLNDILDPAVYPRNKHPFVIDMMRKFELCFDFEGYANRTFLIPDLLQKNEPDTGDWSDSLAFEYHYDVLPGSVISRFIVRMHTYVSKNTYWRNGVVLLSEDKKNRALVRADSEEKKIYIRVTGEDKTRRRFLEIIRSDFHKIHETIPEIRARQKVPLPNYPDIVVDYAHLVNLELLGKRTFVPEGLLEEISVRELLDGIDEPDKRISKDESLSHSTENQPIEAEMKKNNPWLSGSFYLFVFVVVMVTLALMSYYVAWYILPLAFIAGLLAIPIIGVLQSLNDGTLTEKGFITVISESYQRLFLLKNEKSPQKMLQD